MEKIKLSADLSGDDPRQTWAQTKERAGNLEEEISELQARKAELEQLLQTDDSVYFLQVCHSRKIQLVFLK